jgi:hypothetical protein
MVPAFAALERGIGLNRFVAISPWIVFVARKTGK